MTGKQKKCFWAIVKAHDIPVGTAYDIASEALGRPLAPDFGLSTCSKPEGVRILDALMRRIGQEPGNHRPGPTSEVRRQRSDPTKIIRLASKAERDLALGLAVEVFGPDMSSTGLFAAFLVRATGKRELRQLTHAQMRKVIEALKAMQARGWKPEGRDVGPGIQG